MKEKKKKKKSNHSKSFKKEVKNVKLRKRLLNDESNSDLR